MKKNLSRILSYTASAVAMSAILAVTVPADLFGQNGGAFAEGNSTTTCPYGDASCKVTELKGTHNHAVAIGTGCSQQTISGGMFTGSGITITVKSGGKITGGSFGTVLENSITINVENGGEITGGTFGSQMSVATVKVTGGTISGGEFNNSVTVEEDTSGNKGEITGGTFNANIVVENGGVISGDTYASDNGSVKVNSGGTITGGTFDKQVALEGGTITEGTFNNSATKVNSGIIKGGTFHDFANNYGTIEGGTFLESCGTIGNYYGTITGGTFYCTVTNGDRQQKSGSISGGDFWGKVENRSNGTISGGSFYGTVKNEGSITGGGFVVLPEDLWEGGNIRIISSPSSEPTSEVPASEVLISVVPVNTHTHIIHTHSYSWVTVQEATVGQDGIEEYRCSCGDVQERCVIPSSMVFVKGLYGAVKDAPQNGTATFDSGRLYTISDYVIKKLAERSDVTTVITFEYQKQSYRMTIPAGADYTALLTDQDYFYGYFYFANAVGAAIEAL